MHLKGRERPCLFSWHKKIPADKLIPQALPSISSSNCILYREEPWKSEASIQKLEERAYRPAKRLGNPRSKRKQASRELTSLRPLISDVWKRRDNVWLQPVRTRGIKKRT